LPNLVCRRHSEGTQTEIRSGHQRGEVSLVRVERQGRLVPPAPVAVRDHVSEQAVGQREDQLALLGLGCAQRVREDFFGAICPRMDLPHVARADTQIEPFCEELRGADAGA
jgi:hypothetical protein